MKIVAFLFSLIPLLGSALMAYEGTFGRLLTGEKLTLVGKKWMKQVALWGAVSDITLVGGIFLRGLLRFTFYYGRTNKKLIVKKESVTDVENVQIQQVAQVVQSQKQQAKEEEVAQKLAEMKIDEEMDETERQKLLADLKQQAETDLVARAAYQKITDDMGLSKEDFSKTNKQNSANPQKINHQGIPSRKSANQITKEKESKSPEAKYQTAYQKNQEQLASVFTKTRQIEKKAQADMAKEDIKQIEEVQKENEKKIPGLLAQTFKQAFEKK